MIRELTKEKEEYKEKLEKIRTENTEKDVINRYYRSALERARTENIEKDMRNARLIGKGIDLKMQIRKITTQKYNLKKILKRLAEENTDLRQQLRLELEEQ